MFKKCKQLWSNIFPKKTSPNFNLDPYYNNYLNNDSKQLLMNTNENETDNPLHVGINSFPLGTDVEKKPPDLNFPFKSSGNIRLNTESFNFETSIKNLLNSSSFKNERDDLFNVIADTTVFKVPEGKNSSIDRPRLRIEKKIVRAELPQFKFVQLGSTPCFEGSYTSTTTENAFTLRVELPDHYPDQMPKLFITSPITLRKSDGGRINDMGASHDYHTLGTGLGGCIEICHFNEASWDASRTCVAVLIKGILWIEAYCLSLINGMTIANIIENLQRRQQ